MMEWLWFTIPLWCISTEEWVDVLDHSVRDEHPCKSFDTLLSFFKFQGTQFLIIASLKDCLCSYESYILSFLFVSYKQTKRVDVCAFWFFIFIYLRVACVFSWISLFISFLLLLVSLVGPFCYCRYFNFLWGKYKEVEIYTKKSTGQSTFLLLVV